MNCVKWPDDHNEFLKNLKIENKLSAYLRIIKVNLTKILTSKNVEVQTKSDKKKKWSWIG